MRKHLYKRKQKENKVKVTIKKGKRQMSNLDRCD